MEVLEGVRIVEFTGLGPAPFGVQLLTDLGAEVVAIRRPGQARPALSGNRPAVELDLRDEGDRLAAADLVRSAHVLVEGFRPGVMERLGLGPDVVMASNPSLVYARMTGWGQTGPRAHTAGHDLTYIAVTGALHLGTRAGGLPTPSANLLGDFGAGGMYLALGIAAALVETRTSGTGRVLDVAIVDGTVYLTGMLHEYRAQGRWSDQPGTNRLDTGAPYYDVYPCAEGGFVAVGALEEPFFVDLLDLLGLDPDLRHGREDPVNWPRLRTRIAAALMTRTRAEWAALALNRDACVAPVLDLSEVHTDPQVAARGTLPQRADGLGWRPRVPWGEVESAPELSGLLERWGLADGTRERLRREV